ncbi:hypothetical protein R1sor_000566 [Riccia sorocarpa]|uniref:Uncharacterized protein n=1 Tax=Riccia sorocarpa TaxID=122646 RepID=A0ABD3GVZ8_9MARC
MRVRSFDELHGNTLRRLQAADRLDYLPDRSIRVEGPHTGGLDFLKQWQQNRNRDGVRVTDPHFWRNDNVGNEAEKSWIKPNLEWKKLILQEVKMRAKMNASWGLTWSTEKWRKLWKQLWGAKLFLRDKLWIWRVLNKGFSTMERTSTYGVTTAECTRYQTALAIIFASYSRFTWKDRCKAVFEGGTANTPLQVILSEAANTAKKLCRNFKATAKLDSLQTGETTIRVMIAFLLSESTQGTTCFYLDSPPQGRSIREMEDARIYESEGTNRAITTDGGTPGGRLGPPRDFQALDTLEMSVRTTTPPYEAASPIPMLQELAFLGFTEICESSDVEQTGVG